MSKAKNGQSVRVHYKGTLNDGTVFDDSRTRGETLNFDLGENELLPRFEEEVVGMTVGETKEFTIKEAYGARNPEALMVVPKTAFPENFDFSVGATVAGTNTAGQPMHATISSVEEGQVVLDHNHPLAGSDLTFEVELVDVE